MMACRLAIDCLVRSKKRSKEGREKPDEEAWSVSILKGNNHSESSRRDRDAV